jgi:hypothetical protein
VKVFFYQNHTAEPQLLLKTPKIKHTCNPNWSEHFEDKSMLSNTGNLIGAYFIYFSMYFSYFLVSFNNPANYVLFTVWDWEKMLVHKSLYGFFGIFFFLFFLHRRVYF